MSHDRELTEEPVQIPLPHIYADGKVEPSYSLFQLDSTGSSSSSPVGSLCVTRLKYFGGTVPSSPSVNKTPLLELNILIESVESTKISR